MHRQKDERDVPRHPANFSRSVETVQERHRQVEDGHVRAKRPGQPHCLVTIRRLADHLEPVTFQKSLQAVANHLVVIGDQHVNRHTSPPEVR